MSKQTGFDGTTGTVPSINEHSVDQSPDLLQVVFHPDYVCPLPDGHRFPMRKFGELHERLPSDRVDVVRPIPVSETTLKGVHDPEYVRRFQRGEWTDAEERRVGLPWSEELVQRTLTAVGGTVRTVKLALKHGIACNTAGGTHHASPSRGAGFCILNDLAVAGRYVVEQRGISPVLILDADVHQGDGTARAFEENSDVITCSIHCGDNYPFNKARSDKDVTVPPGTGDDRYLNTFQLLVEDLLEEVDPALVLYDAGVDVHRGDRLGKLLLTSEGIRRRDRFVIQQCLHHNVPLAAVIGGGYDRDIQRLVNRHKILHESALDLITAGTGVQ